MTTATDMLQRYIDAEQRVLSGQSVQWGDRQLTLSDIDEIRAGRREWEHRVAAEQRPTGTRRYARAVFSDDG